jgi:phosphatidylinositol alpha-mannosyltransferase
MPTDYLGKLLQLPNSATIHHGLPIPDQAVTQLHSRSIAPPIRLVYQGRLVNTKGIGTLMEAVALLHQRQREFTLVVIGDGPEKKALQDRVVELGIDRSVRFAGRLGDHDLAATLAASDILIVPSLAGEVFGLVVAENMARGMAIVASDIGAFSEVLGSAGNTFRTGDAADLADQLDSLMQNPARIAMLGIQAQNRVFEYFERSKMIHQHANLYRKALEYGIEGGVHGA